MKKFVVACHFIDNRQIDMEFFEAEDSISALKQASEFFGFDIPETNDKQEIIRAALYQDCYIGIREVI